MRNYRRDLKFRISRLSCVNWVVGALWSGGITLMLTDRELLAVAVGLACIVVIIVGEMMERDLVDIVVIEHQIAAGNPNEWSPPHG